MGEKTPWEHHASAAGLPRYNYNVLSSRHCLKGFLITCALDREKSATKEAMAILTKHFGSSNLPDPSEFTEVAVVEESAQLHAEKKLRGQLSCTTDEKPVTVGSQKPSVFVDRMGDNGACGNSLTSPSHSTQTAENHALKDAADLKRSRAEFEHFKAHDDSNVFLLKMAQKGIISVFWESSKPYDPVIMLSKVLADVESGAISPSRWCQRMVPVQASCVYSRESLSALVTKLVVEYLGNCLPTETQPLKYAVSFNRRGFETRDLNDSGSAQNGLDRMTCIHLVTAAVVRVTPHTNVDLRSPEMVVIVEVIPFAGVQSSPICGVAVLSGALMNAKPRLSVKSLVPATGQVKG